MDQIKWGKVAKWLAIIAIVAFAVWETSSRAAEAELSLGQGISNTQGTFIAYGLRWGDAGRWGVAMMHTPQINGGDDSWVAEATYQAIFRKEKEFRPYVKVGYAHFFDPGQVRRKSGKQLLGGSDQQRLGVGAQWKTLQIEYSHYSSAGLYKINTGVDVVMFSLHIPI